MNVKPISRGLLKVRAEAGDMPNVTELVNGLNGAFAEFKRRHDTRMSAVEKQVDELAIKQSANEMRPMLAANDGPLAQAKAFYRQRAKDRQESKDANLGDLFRAVAGLKPESGAIMASLAEGTNSDGGFSVPNIVMPKILDALVAQSSLLQAGAQVTPVEGGKSFTTAAIDTLPTAAWRKELGSVTESAPTFRGVVATPKSLACIVRVSRELLADGADISRAITQALAQSFALELDRVGLLGTGTDPEPKGLANVSGINAVSMGTNGAALAGYAPILSGIQSILDADGPLPTAAIMAPRTLVDFAGLTASDDQPLQPPALVQGVKFLQTSQVPIDDTQGSATAASRIFLGDFTRCRFVVRESLSVQRLVEAYAKTGELGFLCHLRADVAVDYPQAFAIVSGVLAA